MSKFSKFAFCTFIALLINSMTIASADTFKSNLSKNLNEATEWQVQLPQALGAYGSGAVFVDIRSLASCEKSHVPGAIRI